MQASSNKLFAESIPKESPERIVSANPVLFPQPSNWLIESPVYIAKLLSKDELVEL